MGVHRALAALCVLLAGGSISPPAADPGRPPSADNPCSAPVASARAPLPIVGTPWRLENLDRRGTIDRSRITLEFAADGRIGGHAGCNRYTGAYRLENGALGIDERLASTRMACATQGLMAQERRFFALLPAMTRARVDDTGALVLTGPDGATMSFRLDEDAGREMAPRD